MRHPYISHILVARPNRSGHWFRSKCILEAWMLSLSRHAGSGLPPRSRRRQRPDRATSNQGPRLTHGCSKCFSTLLSTHLATSTPCFGFPLVPRIPRRILYAHPVEAVKSPGCPRKERSVEQKDLLEDTCISLYYTPVYVSVHIHISPSLSAVAEALLGAANMRQEILAIGLAQDTF